jgi:short-subunit dehydrogenase
MNKESKELLAHNHLKNKTIVITGASSGAGRAAAVRFADYGARLVLAARRVEALEELATECRERGATVQVVATDVADAASVKALAAAAQQFGGHIDIWVNNAGVLAAGAFDETPIEVSEQVIRTNLMGYMHGVYAVLPYFKQQKEGILINNISIGAWVPVPFGAAYSASKFGIKGFMDAIAGELRSWKDIHVCNLYPAFLDTPGTQHAANYTGKYLKPAPPVFDPLQVAQAMVDVAIHPKRSKLVGWAALFMRLGGVLVPGLVSNMAGKVIETYLKNAEPSPASSGNVLQPVDYGTSIHGGWGLPSDPDKKKTINGLVIAAATTGLYLMTRRRKAKDRAYI